MTVNKAKMYLLRYFEESLTKLLERSTCYLTIIVAKLKLILIHFFDKVSVGEFNWFARANYLTRNAKHLLWMGLCAHKQSVHFSVMVRITFGKQGLRTPGK